MDQHRRVISEKLDNFAQCERVRRKYAWVAQYHNWVCSSSFYDLPDLAISGGLDHLESTYRRQMSLLIPESGMWNGQPGRPPASQTGT